MDISLVSTIIILGTAAGICIPVGGLIASFEHIRPNWLEQEFRHFLIAFGGGILLGAVSVVLVPEGTAFMSDSVFSIPFCKHIINGIYRYCSSICRRISNDMALWSRLVFKL